ncbi:multifunctional protein ADE2-like isoform X2 [Pseudophryne corroboree]|uniref:multifunctional protein ADE2-like isoform X2 n=1 Tax=Pseudophryne corroboree TaxID=495146 RepID=UPI003081D87F
MENIKEEPADTDSMSSTSHEQYYSHVGDKAIKEENEPELENEANKDFRIMTVNDSVASRNLSDHEVRSLLQVWSDEKVSHQLKDSQVPAKIHISDQKMTYVPDKPPPGLPVTVTIGRMQDSERFINQHGDYQQEHHSFTTQLSQLQARCKRNGSLYSRSAKRCRSSSGKFRKVSKDIICLPAEYPEENCTYRVPRGKEREQLAMQGLVGKILIQSSWSFENFRSEVVSLFRKHFSCSDNEFSFNFLQCLPGNRKLIKPNVSASFKWSGIAIISLAAQGSLYIKTQHTLAAPAQNLFFNSKQRLPDVDSDGEHMNVRNASPSDIQKVEVSQRTAARLVNSSSPLNMENSQYCALKNFEAPLHSASIPGFSAETKSTTGMRLGEKRNQGKCEAMYEHPEHPGILLMPSKDHIATGNEARRDQLIGKASNMTTSCVLKLLQEAGIKTACVRKFSEKGFITSSCEIIPIEWVCWRMATGSYLKRHPDVEEGCRLSPPKVEMFSKDNTSNDLQCSEERLLAAKVTCAGRAIGQSEINIMSRSTVAIFEILERSCLAEDFRLINIKIKFGVDTDKNEIVLADVMDYDSWHQSQLEAKTQQNDKQRLLSLKSPGRVVVLMESISYLVHCDKIKVVCASYGIQCELRVTSADIAPEETLQIKSQYEGDDIPTVFITVASRSYGLASMLSANTAYPVINCPPVTADWSDRDVCSTLRTPENTRFCTVLSPQAAAQFAVHILGLSSHLLWAKLRSSTLNNWVSLKQADVKLRECTM